MTNWEYSELDMRGSIREGVWIGPDDGLKTRKVSMIVWLNELAQDGWEVIGYTVDDGISRGKSCLLKRAVE